MLAEGQRAGPAAPYGTWFDSPGFWLYTSGTTGTPKAAMHRHGSIARVCETYAHQVLGITPEDRCYSVAKLFFAYGIGNSLFFPFSVGATAVLDPARATPAGAAARLAEDRPSLFFAGPAFFAALLAADVPAEAFASVRLATSAGEALPAEIYRRFTSRYGVDIIDGLGSTEALHIFISNRPGAVRPGTSGTVVPGYEARLVDDQGEPVADGQPGRLLVRGDSIATGYWCRVATTRQVFAGEWLRTGDTYVRSEDGFYTCLGRTNDMIKAGGIWVSPTEVEARHRPARVGGRMRGGGPPRRRRPGGGRRVRGAHAGPGGRRRRAHRVLPGGPGRVQAAPAGAGAGGPAEDRDRQDPAGRRPRDRRRGAREVTRCPSPAPMCWSWALASPA